MSLGNAYEQQRMAELAHIAPPAVKVTPLQALARAIKALSYRDMERLAAALDDDYEDKTTADAILAAADKLEAGG